MRSRTDISGTSSIPIVGTDDFLEIATTRPETMLGDTAIAVHPDDERYKDIVGKKCITSVGKQRNSDRGRLLCRQRIRNRSGKDYTGT